MTRAAGPFEILEVLGEGSFGTVCVARVSADPLRRKVALKILKGAYAANTKILNRTRDEARLLSRISHPNIVKVERLMEVNGRPVVVMEHVQGVSLDQLLLRFKEGIPAGAAIEIVRHMCLALHVAYAETVGADGRPLKVIHRDIKPSNVMLSIHGVVKVLDFGIARGEFEGREANTESVVMGSRPYMAPERLDGVSDSPLVDVYSSGMSLYELLTGRTMSLSINPVSHDQAMTRQLEHVVVPGMSAKGQEDIRDLIRRMCAYMRDNRPPSSDCVRILERLIHELPSDQRIPLEDFAKNTVLPLYESRPKVSPDEAFGGASESDFLITEITGTKSTPKTKIATQPGRQAKAWLPYAVIGVTGFLVMTLAIMAMMKFMGSVSTSGNMVSVNVWIPPKASAVIEDEAISGAGTIKVERGTSMMILTLKNGKSFQCTFRAKDGVSVRWAGEGSISINDGDPVGCVPLKTK